MVVCFGCNQSGLSASGDGGGTDGGGADLHRMPEVPLVHRATADPCPTTRPPGGCTFSGPLSSCTSDAQCTAGNNGRCTGDPHDGCRCTYDECVTDGDCASGTLCDCRTPGKGLAPGPNRCLTAGCRLDSDCGAGGYCSPTLDPSCGAFTGRTGWYCHTASDTCTNDRECPMDGGAGAYCGYHPEVGHWQCGYTVCAG